MTGAIRQIAIDQNPLIPESLYSTLIGEESCIRTLSLRANNITDVGAKLIANALKTNHVLVALDLFENKIQRFGAESFGEVINVTHLRLSNTTLHYRYQSELTQSLSLGKNTIGDDGVRWLTKVPNYLNQ